MPPARRYRGLLSIASDHPQDVSASVRFHFFVMDREDSLMHLPHRVLITH